MRKYTTQDRSQFKEIFLQFSWIPPSHLAVLMQTMASAGVLPARWCDFNEATAYRWMQEGGWRDQVESLKLLVADDALLPNDDEIDDRLMRRNLQILDILGAQILGNMGDPRHTMKSYLALQAQIRTHVQARRAIPLTPVQLVELAVKAGHYAAGGAFDELRFKEFLVGGLQVARQISRTAEAA